MTRRLIALATTLMLFAGAAGLRAQERSAPAPKTPARVDVVLTRSQGDKKVSSLPFTLIGTTDGSWTNLRVGVDVPVGTTTRGTATQANNPTTTSTTQPSYRSVGTDVDASVSSTNQDGRYTVNVRLSDSSIFTGDSDGRAIPRGLTDPAAFRTFSANNALPMRDGQTMLFATATDKVSGELLKVEVTLTIMK